MAALNLWPPALPSRIIEPLRGVVRRQQRIAAVSAAVQVVAWSLLILLCVSALLGWIAFPRFLRLPIAAVAWAALIYTAVRSVRPALTRWTLSRAARAVEAVFPDLQERLSSAVELTLDEPHAAFRGSPQLLEHLVHQAQRHAGRIDPRAIIATDRLLRQTLLLMSVCIAWIALATNPRASLALQRGMFHTLVPWRAHLPASLANLVVLPGDAVIAEGNSLDITARMAARLGSPGHATLLRTFANGQSLTQPMEMTGDGAFHLALADLMQDCTYSVQTDLADSERYKITVHPRPAINRLDVHYDFPAYTALPPLDQRSDDGEIRALAGSRVTLTVHTTAPIVIEKSRLEISQTSHEAESVGFTAAGELRYQAHFIVNRSGSYRIRLINGFDLENQDNQPRPIFAVFDQAPAVLIASPQGTVTVPPDDSVPVEYLASDDFAVASLRAVVGVDDQPKKTIELPISDANRKHFNGSWVIDIRKIIAQSGVKSAARISYQLQAIDNRDPDPQAGSSAEQVLLIDANQNRSYADQLNEQRKRRLEDDIRKALERLRQADWRVGNLKNADDRHILNPDERRDAGELRDLLATASRDLSAAADEFIATPYASVAREARDVAEHPMAAAAEDVAKAQFAADVPLTRQQTAAAAQLQITEASKRLEKLLPAAEQAQRQAEAAEALRQAAGKQRDAAEAMADDPQNVDQNRRTQQQAMDKLNDAMNKDPSLRNPQARELAEKLADLTQKIEDDQSRQTVLAQTTARQEQELEKQAARSNPSAAAKNRIAAAQPIAKQQHDLAAQTHSLRDVAKELADRGRQQRGSVLASRADAAEKSLDQAAQAQQSAADAESRDEPDQVADQQQQAQDALNKADEALRGAAEAANESGESSKDGRQADGSPDASPSPQSGQEAAKAENGSGQSDAAQQAAQAAQEAAAAQRQAMRPNPAAARQAERALSRAQAAARAAQNERDSARANGGDRPGQQSADAGSQSSPAQQASEKDGPSANSRSGIRGENIGAANTPPASVRDLGISAGDWAKLPPLMQHDLMNAAQQSGPPAYREMIRDYYVRIANIESQKSASAPGGK